MINVYSNEMREKVVARVNYNSRLDHWDGSNWTSGGVGCHLGITRLKKSGQMVIIYGTQWQGERDYGVTVSDEEALQAILNNDPNELENWPHLQKLAEETISTEA